MSRLAIGAMVLLCGIVLCALFAPLISPYDPDGVNLDAILLEPSAAHWFGTDELGRDLFSRVMYGARPSLLAAAVIVCIGASIGFLIGCVTGLLGGVFDLVTMRLVEVMMALPGLVVAMALTAALGPSLRNAVIAIGVMSIPAYIRVARGETLALRDREFVQYARVSGGGRWHIIWLHLVPNVLPPMLIFMTFHLGSAILASSALSFIGLGAQPPSAEWGALIGVGRDYLNVQWWYCLFPGLFIVATALSVNLLGDALRDMVDAP